MEESVRLDQLNYFVEVAKSGSINHAAQRLFATQQTVNAALKRLEKELGYTLLVRSASGVTLTEHGEIFLPFAQLMVEQFGAVLAELRSVSPAEEKKLAGSLTIGDASALGEIVLPEVLKTYRQKYPQVKVRLSKSDSDRVWEAFCQRQYDVVLVTAAEEYLSECLPRLPEESECCLLLADQAVVCLRASDPLAGKSVLTQAEFAQRPYAVYGLLQVPQFREASLREALYISNDADFCKKLMLQNLCVTLSSQLAYEYLFRSRRLVSAQLEGTTRRVLHAALYWQDDGGDNGRAFLAALSRSAEKLKMP